MVVKRNPGSLALSPGKKANRMFPYGGIRPKNVRELLTEFAPNYLSRANSKLVAIVAAEWRALLPALHVQTSEVDNPSMGPRMGVTDTYQWGHVFVLKPTCVGKASRRPPPPQPGKATSAP